MSPACSSPYVMYWLKWGTIVACESGSGDKERTFHPGIRRVSIVERFWMGDCGGAGPFGADPRVREGPASPDPECVFGVGGRAFGAGGGC